MNQIERVTTRAARLTGWQQGLTLLEVLAAVALLGLVYTALASRATQGVMSESDSLRRFHATLHADAALAQVEIEVASGNTPVIGTERFETEDGIYSVKVETSAWSPPLPDPDPGQPPLNAPNLLEHGNVREGILLRVQVVVTWHGVAGERSIDRTTFVLNHRALDGVAPSADAGRGATS